MPQKRILLEPGRTYHIWTRANGSENLFRCDENFRYFLGRYQHHVHPVIETFAYCLMPNHLHLMVRVKREEELVEYFLGKVDQPDLTGFQNLSGLVSKQFSNLFNSYSKAYNKLYDRKGSLFMRGFNRKLIDSDEYFVRLIAYIHNNPVHHRFVLNPGAWEFSSWHAYLMNKSTKINTKEAMHWFGNNENFEAIHRELNHAKMKTVFEE